MRASPYFLVALGDYLPGSTLALLRESVFDVVQRELRNNATPLMTDVLQRDCYQDDLGGSHS